MWIGDILCGLIGGFELTCGEVLQNLEKLQYRGYDSGGVLYFDKNILQGKRWLGKITQDLYGFFDDKQHTIIGHCRWGDKGVVSLVNTHPVHCGSILLAHNGSITNYEDIKTSLNRFTNQKNFPYNGETDTEVIAHYLNWAIDSNKPLLKDEFHKEFFRILKGTWAFVWLVNGEKDKIYFSVKDSPLYYYENKLASDSEVFEKCLKIPNNSWGYIEKDCKLGNNGYGLNINGSWVEPNYNIITLDKGPSIYKIVNEEKSSGQNEHMWAEICEQAELEYNPQSPFFEEWWAKRTFDENILLLGCGSSHHANLLAQKLNEDSDRITVNYASEYNYVDGKYDLIVATSQSGESADVQQALRNISDYQNTLLITNRDNSSCRDLVKNEINIGAKFEQAVAATKTFTCTIFSLYKLMNSKYFESCFIQDTTSDAHLNKFRKMVGKLVKEDHSNHIKNTCSDILAHKFSNFLCLGRHLNYISSLETSLKIKEVANIFCEGMSAAESKHGPLSLISDKVLGVFLFGGKFDTRYEQIIGNARQIKDRGGKILGIGPYKEKVCDWYIPTPKTAVPLYNALLNNINGQILAYWLGKLQNLDVDCPAMICKSVTVY